MVYQKGRVFHTQCYITHGSSFPTPDSDLTTLNARTRIDLVQLKNLKVRKEHEVTDTSQVTKRHSPKKKTSKKKSTKSKTKNKKRVKAKKTKKGTRHVERI
jgi:hypothetical protein